MKKGIILLVSALFALPALADDIQLGQPAYGGSGCPQGSASATLSPDNKSLSILFDSYTTEAGGMSGKTLDRKSCNVAIPVHVPQGYSVSIFQVDYRGFNSLPQGASSQFNVEYFFAGAQGPAFRKNFYGAISDNYTVSTPLMASALVWSRCGQDVILRTNSSMMTRTNRNFDQADSSVDSVDVGASIVYQLQWKRCS